MFAQTQIVIFHLRHFDFCFGSFADHFLKNTASKDLVIVGMA